MKWIGIAALALLGGALASAQSDMVIDEDVRVSAAKVRPVEFDLSSMGARVLCTFQLEEGSTGVRAVLLRRSDVRLWLTGRPHHALASTEWVEAGGFSAAVDAPGEYAVVLDNRMEARSAAVVRLQVRVVAQAEASAPVRRADPARALALVWGSVLGAGAAALFAGWHIARALQSRAAAGL
jgi:hypothetical protein